MKICKQNVFKFRTFLENLVKFCQYFFERITRIYLINHNRTFSAISIGRHSLYQSNITVFFTYNLNTICSFISWNEELFWFTSFAIFRICSKVIFVRRFTKIFLTFVSEISYFFATSM